MALLVLLAVLLYLPAAPPLHPIPDRDGGVFLYVAGQILRGAVPYRDVWDHKPPGAYILPVLGLVMTPESLWGPWALAVLLLACAAYVGYLVLQRQVGIWLSLGITCTWLLALTSFVRRDPFLTETTALPFQMGSFAFAIWLDGHSSSKGARWAWLALGGSIAACLMLKPPLAGLPLLAAVLAFSRCRHAERLANAGWAGLGLLVPLGAILLYAVGNNALEPLIDQVFFYNMNYSSVPWSERAAAAREALQADGVVTVTAGIAWVSLGWALQRGAVPVGQRFFPFLLWIAWPLDLALASFSGRSYLHYFIGSFWLEMALIGWFLNALMNHLAWGWIVRWYRIVFLGILLLSSAVSWYQTLTLVSLGDAERQAAVAYLNARLPRDVPVLFWGAETSLYVATQRTAPTRIIYQYPLYTMGYRTAALSQELREDIEKQNPRIIVDTSATDPLIPPLSRDGLARWRSPVRTYGMSAGGGLVSDYVLANYVQIDLIAGVWPVYEHK